MAFQTSDDERAAMVMSCERLIASIAQRYARRYGLPFDDLRQEAAMVCYEATLRWMPDRGAKFSTYATSAMKRHLSDIVRQNINAPMSYTDAIDEREHTYRSSRAIGFDLSSQQLDALASLKPRAKEVVMLCIAGFTPSQIGEQLDERLKDVRLILRNSARILSYEFRRQSFPSLF